MSKLNLPDLKTVTIKLLDKEIIIKIWVTRVVEEIDGVKEEIETYQNIYSVENPKYGVLELIYSEYEENDYEIRLMVSEDYQTVTLIELTLDDYRKELHVKAYEFPAHLIINHSLSELVEAGEIGFDEKTIILS